MTYRATQYAAYLATVAAHKRTRERGMDSIRVDDILTGVIDSSEFPDRGSLDEHIEDVIRDLDQLRKKTNQDTTSRFLRGVVTALEETRGSIVEFLSGDEE